MRRLAALTTFAVSSLLASSAQPCGGGFGMGLEMGPSQKIAIRHDGAQETYVFSPHFCGTAAEFGLVLPLPGALTENPALAEAALFTALDELSAPEVVTEDVCQNSRNDGIAGGASWDAGASGVSVINSGQVGIFDWTLLQAESQAAFTDWLDVNGYPYDADAAPHFEHYVGKAWYFVAFKVTAGEAAPPAGSELCGDLGPIRLTFASDVPVVPSRIAAVGEGRGAYFEWRVFAFADQPLDAGAGADTQTLYFAHTLAPEDLANHPEVLQLAVAGDQLTTLDLAFYGASVTDDITLVPSTGPTEYRSVRTEYRYVECTDSGEPLSQAGGDGGGCTIGGAPSRSALLGVGLLLLGGVLLRFRRL